MDDRSTGRELPEAECWVRLRGEEFGRLGYHLVDEVHIVPLNYVVDGERIVLRTTPGSKLLGVEMSSDVAFEIDGQAGDRVWSVLARGQAHRLEGADARAADELPLPAWIETERYVNIAIQVTELTGREFLRRG
ncbi:pyridoxamine 5'-phosphate oxidase family protein [Ornithinicoccus hortensis]|uniref:Pyridoxamine 5'-phosphate oxidase-like protein n=1 Tax=Ornithinicoccus hortensis TaxID=82346 RepID=A0A542YN20_9MICO|nr:pyridoxamine 5'-phosphate oxidase family protein [Ornithinicoccus hortensis]TQL49502.1 hypothetical protein FB467_0575 [Ornithinicoccus hortensis]